MAGKKIVLCSASPRRQLLLKEMGFLFEIKKKEVAENFPEHLKAGEVAVFLAEKKMQAIGNAIKADAVYITADTIVWLDDEILGKPVDQSDAISMLKKLSGKLHQVFTAVCLSSLDRKEVICVKSDVLFNELSHEEIKSYVEHFAPFDKAGSYGAQECLPEGLNPCSKEEIDFLHSIHQHDLFERTLSKNQKHVPMIKRIEGSYFNVMGLPVVELFSALKKWQL